MVSQSDAHCARRQRPSPMTEVVTQVYHFKVSLFGAQEIMILTVL